VRPAQPLSREVDVAQCTFSFFAQHHPSLLLACPSGPVSPLAPLAHCARVSDHNTRVTLWHVALGPLGQDTILAGAVLLELLEDARGAGAVPAQLALAAHDGALLEALVTAARVLVNTMAGNNAQNSLLVWLLMCSGTCIV
jgi:hypothetical protein